MKPQIEAMITGIPTDQFSFEFILLEKNPKYIGKNELTGSIFLSKNWNKECGNIVLINDKLYKIVFVLHSNIIALRELRWYEKLILWFKNIF